VQSLAAAQREELTVYFQLDHHRPESIEHQAVAVGHLIGEVLNRLPKQ
jgi:hypothetical protein